MKRIILVFILFFILIIHSNSQNVVLKTPAEIALVKAKELLEAKKYEEALKKLEEVLVSEPNNIEANYYMGSVYQAQGQDEMATRYFLKAKEVIAESMKTNIYGTSEILNLHKLRYQQRYATEQPRLLKEPNTMKDPVRLSEPINSPYSDFGPLINPTGARLYFTSRRPDSNQRSILKNKKKGSEESKNKTEIVVDSDEDSYYIEKTGDAWGNPIKLPEPLNSDSNEGVDCFTADNQLMLFTACGLSDGVGSCDLYFSSLEGDRWRNPQNLGNVVNSDGWDGQSSISYDGTKIFFSSARSDSYGSTDIYLVEKNLFGDWGPPSNLGGVVNTPFTEYSPFFSQDGKTLYFASDGHPGFGGLDIFKTIYENGKWSIPINLGKPLNTLKDDRFFSIGGSGELGYFSSDRGGHGDDLYEIEIPEAMRPQPTIVVTGTVTNAKTNEKVGGFVMVEDMDTQELIAVNKSNSVTGKYLVVLPGGRNYSVSANKEGFFFYSQSFDVPKKIHYQEIVKDILLKPIEKGTKVVINNIFFETGKATLTLQSNLELDKAIDLLRTNPTMVIEVGGHTDNVGDDATNMKLSHDRAKAVREYMVGKDIGSDRVQAKGYGESNPIATNDTEDGRQVNRRTEFIILEF